MNGEVEITYTNLDWKHGKKLAVKGIGVLENGVPRTMTKEEADSYKRLTGRTIRQAFAHRGDFTVRNKLAGGEN